MNKKIKRKGWLLLFEVTLLNSKQCKDLFGGGDFENKITLSSALKKADDITKAVLYNTFFEDPSKDIIGAIRLLKDPVGVNYVSDISKAYYNKHVGRFVKEERERIQKKLEKELTLKFAKIDWPKIAKGDKQ